MVEDGTILLTRLTVSRWKPSPLLRVFEDRIYEPGIQPRPSF
jgi:hypothetical protein